MDLPIQMRCLDLLVKLIRHDVDNIPNYKYVPQKPAAQRAEESRPLPRSTPEAQGLSSAAVERFFREVGASPKVAAHHMMILRHGQVVAEGSWAPYRSDLPHLLYSMSKSVTSTAIGMAVDEGLLSIDERLCDIFPEYVGALTPKSIKAYTVRHLLTMSTGSRFNEMGSMLDDNWVKMFMETLPKFEPGSSFDYNSLNSYMLAALLKRKTGKNLVEFLKPRLFIPLHIEEYSWEVCPHGTEKGGWGLSLRIEDAAKIGQLYLQKGVWEGKRLLSEEWIAQATSQQIATPNGECRRGYGFQIWMNPVQGFQFNGAFGQFVVILPQYDAVVAVLAGSTSLYMDTPLQQLIDGCFFAAADPLPENPPAYASLQNCLQNLTYSPDCSFEGLGTDEREFDYIADMLDGKEYRFSNNVAGLYPQGLTAVHGNYTRGMDILRFEKAENGLKLVFYEHTERNTLLINRDGSFFEQFSGMRGESQRLGVRGLWKLSGSGLRLAVIASFIETPNTRVLLLDIDPDRLQMGFLEYPSLEGSGIMLFELVGYSRTALMRRLSLALERAPQDKSRVSDVIRKFTAPVAAASLVIDNSKQL